jgi:S-formylglutathione hydrolase FrmB
VAQKLSHAKGPKPRLYQCCGTEDFLYDANQQFRRLMGTLDFDYTYEEGPGTHEWGYWDRQIQRVLEWLGVKG